jgi:hypothetical protein
MTARNVCCIASSEAQASDIVTRLKSSGFSGEDIAALLPDKTGRSDFGHEQHTKLPEAALAGVCLGGLAGVVVGGLAGVGFLALPGLGPFIAAGPTLAALSGAAAGAIVGGIVGAVIGLRIPEYVATRYDGKMADGNILISIHVDTRPKARRAREILQGCGGENVFVCREKRAALGATPHGRVARIP